MFLASALMMLASCQSNPVLKIEGGKVKGVVLNTTDCIVYKGIPFAAPPVGELRWKRPQPVEPWEGVKIADSFGNAAVQAAHNPKDGNYGTEFFETDAPFSEDCLYLNVWTPKYAAGHPEKKLPVAMWIHGGAYTGGWGFEPEMDGEAWAYKDVILVTINYRLGVFGFFSHPLLCEENEEGIAGNYGTYDQIAALDWIRNNIAQFGGDPEHIMIFGQSAGAASIKNLCASPLSKDKIFAACIMSGGGVTDIMRVADTQETKNAVGKAVMDEAGLTTLEQMRAADYETLNAAFSDYMRKTHKYMSFGPHNDGYGITKDFSVAAAEDELADVPYMLGYLADDIKGLNSGFETFSNIRAALSKQPTYLYYFQRALPTDGRASLQGAFHSSELWYVFHTLQRSWRPFTAADDNLSHRMVTYWTNFAKYGDPNGNDYPEGSEDYWEASTLGNPNFRTLDIR